MEQVRSSSIGYLSGACSKFSRKGSYHAIDRKLS